MDITWKDPKTLKPYPQNAKKHDKTQIDNVAESIRQFGWKQPIVVDKDGIIIIGHARHQAALQMGQFEVPVLVADELTPDEVKRLRIVDNKVNESPWDFELLESEVDILDFDGFTFDFEPNVTGGDWFSDRERWDTGREEGNDEYNDFLEKFEEKKTTDDCYTPDNVYEAVAEWVTKEYGIDKKRMKRPFFPGGDYQNEKYKKTDVVVDNPPFSILSEIVKWYQEHKIPFFLFAPHTVLSGSGNKGVTGVAVGAAITYENGATVNTCFTTNLEPGVILRTAPDLYKTVTEANKKNLAAMKKELPKYSYPPEVVTMSMMNYMAKYGQDFSIKEKDAFFTSALDEQKKTGVSIFGGGYLLSKKAAAEKAAAEKAAAEKWSLSEREKDIVESLGEEV